MKTTLTAIALAFLSLTAQADQRPPLPASACAAQVPYGTPQGHKSNTLLICRQGYLTLNDLDAKIPVWTAWVITPAHVIGCVPRSNAFAADASLPADKRATPQDYAGNGYDQGHIANDNHQSWDVTVERESFYMSNMTPQLPGLNRGIWKLLETSTGAWTFSTQHEMAIQAGAIYDVKTDKKIGNGVDVPHGFYKIVTDKKTGATLAFIFPHAENQGNDLTKVQATVADVEKATGYTFGIPKGHSKTAKEPIFPTDFKSVAAAKKKQCGSSLD
jgi:endonuclease G